MPVLTMGKEPFPVATSFFRGPVINDPSWSFGSFDYDRDVERAMAYGSDARWWASVMKQGQGGHGKMNGGWYVEGTLAAPSCPGGLTALRSGQFALVQPAGKWRDLLVGGMRLSVARPNMPMGCPLT